MIEERFHAGVLEFQKLVRFICKNHELVRLCELHQLRTLLVGHCHSSWIVMHRDSVHQLHFSTLLFAHLLQSYQVHTIGFNRNLCERQTTILKHVVGEIVSWRFSDSEVSMFRMHSAANVST